MKPRREPDPARALVRWWRPRARPFPWHGTRDPYAVWVSEIMLQQTTVDVVAPYYERWMCALPDVHALAKATRDRVMRLWEGLGYYRRAVNLHRAAQFVVTENAGALPSTEDGWRALPGIGAYTAAAITAIAFNRRTVAIDGLTRRVLFRYLGMRGSASTAKAERAMRARGLVLISKTHARDSVPAIMHLAREVCRIKEPRCGICPIAEGCEARIVGTPERLPEEKKPTRDTIDVAVGLWIRGDRVYLQKRSEDGMFAGLWELPGGKVEHGEKPERAVVREFQEEVGRKVRIVETLPTVRHSYTRFAVTLHPFVVSGRGRAPNGNDRRFVPLGRVRRYAQPAANARIWSHFFERRRTGKE
ncbi:MAG: NUDIX domain-containing protein [Deltaproteobacteria bacterium]|nr:NUDIX domain-containing protein [Deltaproteobacteria bacterium]